MSVFNRLTAFISDLPDKNELKGSFGEMLAKYYSKITTDMLVLNDILIDGYEDFMSQIDLLLISNKGIYVVEVKNYPEAKIYGNGLKRTWYYYLNRKKYDIYSPLLQNKKHILYLKDFLSDFGEIPCFSVILIICKDFEVSNINTEEKCTNVICSSLPAMKKAIKFFEESNENLLTNQKRQEIYDYIIENQHKGKDARKLHKQKVQNMQKEKEYFESNHICPYCKGTLVLREGKYGKFYGCTNYPGCKYTKKL